MKRKRKVLSKIAKTLNANQVKWSLGASFMLNIRGLNVGVDDIDIRVLEKDFTLVKEILAYKGKVKEVVPNKKYQTKHFIKLEIDGIKIDVMAGFKVVKEGIVYSFPLDENKAFDTEIINNEIIYLDSVHEWYEIYLAMERVDKIKRIEAFLETKSSNHVKTQLP